MADVITALGILAASTAFGALFAGIAWLSGMFRSPWTALSLSQFLVSIFLVYAFVRAHVSLEFPDFDLPVSLKALVASASWGIWWCVFNKDQRDQLQQVKLHSELVSRTVAQMKSDAKSKHD
jgi:hypothetical protein